MEFQGDRGGDGCGSDCCSTGGSEEDGGDSGDSLKNTGGWPVKPKEICWLPHFSKVGLCGRKQNHKGTEVRISRL